MTQFYEIRLISHKRNTSIPVTIERWESEFIARRQYKEWVDNQPNHDFQLIRVTEQLLEP